MALIESGQYINPARISPERVSATAIKSAVDGSGGNFRLSKDGSPAICVTAGMCLDSRLIEPVYTSGSDAMLHKYIAVIFHSQDWQRWEAFMCQLFGKPRMYANMADSALQIGSVKVRPAAPQAGDSSKLFVFSCAYIFFCPQRAP